MNYLATFHNDQDNVTALVYECQRKGGGFSVALRDDDAGKIVGSIAVLPTLQAAVAKAQEYAA